MKKFDIWNNATESTIKYWKFEKYWIEHNGNRSGSYFHALTVTIYSTTIRLRPTHGDATTTTNWENWQ